MPYKFSKRSLSRLSGVHPALADIAHEALAISKCDFGISSGLRTLEEQYALYAAKPARKSWLNGVEKGKAIVLNGVEVKGTGRSKHQEQADGHSHAIDIYVFRNGKVSWARESFYPAMYAFREAALKSGAKIVSGAFWGDLAEHEDLRQAVKEYAIRKRRRGKKVFYDFPHFQIEF